MDRFSPDLITPKWKLCCSGESRLIWFEGKYFILNLSLKFTFKLPSNTNMGTWNAERFVKRVTCEEKLAAFSLM
jgi:hypothetical protein